MKKINFLMALLLLMELAGATRATAQNQNHDFTQGGLYYKIDSTEVTVVPPPRGSDRNATKITIPASVTHNGKTYRVTRIGGAAFQGFRQLAEVVLPDGLTTVEWSVFSGSALKTITLPKTVTYFSESALDYCELFEGYQVHPENPAYTAQDGILYSKGKSELVRCPQQKAGTLKVPAGIMYIGVVAFNGCTNLTTIELPESLLSIGVLAFSGTKLTTIKIPKQVKEIGHSAFPKSIKNIEIAPENSYFTFENGWLFDKSKKTLLAFIGQISGPTITIPKSVVTIEAYVFNNGLYDDGGGLTLDLSGNTNLETIGGRAFDQFYGLTKVIFPENLKTIGEAAFQYCAITSLDFSKAKNLTKISQNAFFRLESLTEVDLSACEKLDTIGHEAFSPGYGAGSSNRLTVSLPAGLKFIGDMAFYLKKLTVKSPTPLEVGLAFGYSPDVKDATLVVPSKSVARYKAARVWKEFGKIEGTTVSNEAVEGSRVWAAAGRLYLTLPVAETIHIYNVDGRLVRTLTLAAGEHTVDLPSGIYIVTGNGWTTKVKN